MIARRSAPEESRDTAREVSATGARFSTALAFSACFRRNITGPNGQRLGKSGLTPGWRECQNYILKLRSEGLQRGNEEIVMECYCHCHHNPDIRHVTPCCSPCPYCGMRVVIGWMEEHLEKCVGKKIDLVMDEKGKIL
jgi:hypothetical protein